MRLFGTCRRTAVVLRVASRLTTNVVHSGHMDERQRTITVKARITPRQRERLEELAEARFGGNLSAALRQALTDADLLRMARHEFRRLVTEQGLRLPRDQDGFTTPLEGILGDFFGNDWKESE